MRLLCGICLKYPSRLPGSYKLCRINQISRLLSTFSSDISTKKPLNQVKTERFAILSTPLLKQPNQSLLIRLMSSQKTANEEGKNEPTNETEKPKKQSKFKQFYSQYGPLFLVVHLTTVVLWIYFFFLISKQGYDITQLLNVFETMGVMSKETVDSIHYKIDNYKMESGWITGQDIKHFATAYMVYKVIAPFRYMVSIYLVRVLVNALRKRGIIKS